MQHYERDGMLGRAHGAREHAARRPWRTAEYVTAATCLLATGDGANEGKKRTSSPGGYDKPLTV
jgi:hypothetical protein